MSACLYDNPRFMRREAWNDGKLVASWSYELICQHSKIRWHPGQVDGDPEAMKAVDQEHKDSP